MWSYETSIDVDAGQDRLWALLADVDGWPGWNAGIKRIELRGPFADGTEFLMQPPGMEAFTSTLADVRPGEGFTDVTVLDGTTVRVHHVLQAMDGQRTRVTYRAEVTGPGEAELGPMVTADFGDVLASLKRLAEGRPARNGPKEGDGTMDTGPFRAVAVLTPKPGQEQALEDFTLQSLPAIRAVPGLRKVEASRASGGPARLVLYYWWDSPAASAAYMDGPLYAEIGPQLASYVQDHVLVVGELLER